jgi:stage V sporulation protein K
VRRGAVSSAELSRTKLFPGMNTLEVAEKVAEDARVASMSVEELMEEEFNKVIGHAGIKQQLRRFYKKVQLDSIREANGRLKNKQGCYHMIFQGPPGTGKTSMANLVAKVMVKMGLTTTPKVVFVNNALDLLAGYAGQTAGKVDDKVKEAEGGVLFIDEAYSIVQNESKESFGREAIDTIMKHLDPPACVFIFAGYVDPMADFVRMNDGLSRRIPFRYTFNPYSVDELLQICKVMSEAKGERLADDVMQPAHLPALIEAVNVDARETHNAGLISNLVSFSQIERDCRIDIEEAQRNPAIACTLAWADFAAAWPKLERMLDRGGGDGNNQKYNDNASDLGSQVQEMHL